MDEFVTAKFQEKEIRLRFLHMDEFVISHYNT
jgi:hypothetical protein